MTAVFLCLSDAPDLYSIVRAIEGVLPVRSHVYALSP